MPARRFRCPECDAVIRPPDAASAGTKVRCPECDALVRPPVDDDDEAAAAPKRRASRDDDDDFDDRPRKRKAAAKTNPAVIAIPILAVVFLAVGGAVAYGIFFTKKDDPNAFNPPPDVAAARPGMPGPIVPPRPGPNTGVAANAGNPRVGLEVGNLAPEIEGEDIDGQRFKLSDYRGKVVMLDFWGNW